MMPLKALETLRSQASSPSSVSNFGAQVKSSQMHLILEL
jgi:hypothetical protein